MVKRLKSQKEVVRISGKLKEIVTLEDEVGNTIHKIISPLMVEFYVRDLLQVIVGATILSIPLAFTEETWRLGEALPMPNIVALGVISFVFMSTFIYYNSYKDQMSDHWFNFFKRVLATYVIALLVVALILTVIEKADWTNEFLLSLKRVIIVALPASLSGAVADGLK
jgi:uncharacterized membrane protein